MEIIFFIMLVMEGGHLAHLETHSYHHIPDDVSRGVSCEEFLRAPNLQRYAAQRVPGASSEAVVRVACLGGQRLASATIEQLVSLSAGWQKVSLARKEETLTGVLQRKPDYDERRKAVSTYLGHEFTLETRDGKSLGLWPSKQVPIERLRGLKGRTVVLRGLFEDRTPDESTLMQVPMGAIGKPLQRAGYRVLEIKEVPPL